MNSQLQPPPASIYIPPTFHAGGEASNFLELMVGMIQQLSDSSEEQLAVEPAKWAEAVTGLSNTLIIRSRPAEGLWSAMHEPVRLVENALRTINLAVCRVRRLFHQDHLLPHAIFVRVASLCVTLAFWIEAEPVQEEGYPSPAQLYSNAKDLMAVTWRNFVEDVDPEKDIIERQELRTSLSRVYGFVEGLMLQHDPRMVPIDFEWNLKSLEQHPAMTSASSTFKLSNITEVVLTLTTLLEMSLVTLSCISIDRSVLSDLVRVAGQCSHKVYDYLFLSCPVAGVTRARAISRICIAITEFATSTGYLQVAEPYWARLLLFRLEAGPDPVWAPTDGNLLAVLRSSCITVQDRTTLYSIVKGLETEEWGDDGKDLRELCEGYLALYVPHLDEGTLHHVRTLLGTKKKTPLYRSILVIVRNRLQDFAAASNTNHIAQVSPVTQWMSVRDAVQAIIEPFPLEWMDDDDSAPEVQHVHRSLEEICHRFERQGLRNPSTEGKVNLAKQLANLPCLIFHGKDQCSADRVAAIPDACFVTAYMKLIPLIFRDDSSPNFNPRVSVAVYDALAKSLRHQTASVEDRLFEDLMALISRGLKDQEHRAVRLAAGRTLVELVKYIHRLDLRPVELLSMIFQRLHPLVRHSSDRVKESAIVVIGQIGKTSDGSALRESVCELVLQMSQPNPVHKGSATLQLLALAKHHKKTPYTLTAPYMGRIAPQLVRRFTTETTGLAEFCAFISTEVNLFLRLTLKYTLPYLFVEGELPSLIDIASRVDEPNVGVLAVKNGASILSHAFMLQGIGQTNRTLQYILNVMRRYVHDDPDALAIESFVRACLIGLLAELVVCLGDEDPNVVDAAKQGLVKACRVAQADIEEPGVPKETTAFLKEYMLGVISHLNDMLQDIRVKHTLESKRAILRSFGEFAMLIGRDINGVAPQIMTSLQSMLLRPDLVDATLSGWCLFLSTLDPVDLGAHVGATSASLVASWDSFSPRARETAKRCLDLLIVERGEQLGGSIAEIADLSSIPELHETHQQLERLRGHWSSRDRLNSLLCRLENANLTVATQAALELKSFLLDKEEEYIRSLTTGDVFDPIVGHLISALYAALSRDEEGIESLQDTVFGCIGVVGAIDPDRFEPPFKDNRLVILSNFEDESEAVDFVLYLIRHVLVGPFLATRDIKYQSYLSFALQQLLTFCQFTRALVEPHSTHSSVPLKVRNRWNNLPRITTEACTPLLEAPLQLKYPEALKLSYPIYPTQSTYRQWTQTWTSDLLYKISGEPACTIFMVFRPIVRHRDVGVAHHLLPHVVLNVLAYGDEEHRQAIRGELIAILKDQVDPNSTSTPDKKLYSAQTVFMLLDHFNKWLREMRQYVARKAAARRSSRQTNASDQSIVQAQEALVRMESVLASIDSSLMAEAAFECKAYARTLMVVEQLVVQKRERNAPPAELQAHYERLHEIYAQLDEPDGMEGVSTMILSPSLEHQIRQHESTGRWTAAQSCWEVQLQHEPDNMEYHLGLLRCLRNLGHYDSLRTHVMGVLTKHPEWSLQLVGYQAESEWMVGHWEAVETLISGTDSRSSLVLMAQVLLAIRRGDSDAISSYLAEARRALGVAIIASGSNGYRRSYDAVLDLHLMRELEVIGCVVKDIPPDSATQNHTQSVQRLLQRLASRFDSTLPAFRVRESVLNMRRTAFNLNLNEFRALEMKDATGKLWLNSAKIARKAGHSQTAYSAILQARRSDTPFSFIESAKLVRARGEPLRALQELENSMRSEGILARQQQHENVVEMTEITEETRFKAKAHALHARWMADSERYEDTKVYKEFQTGADMWPRWESGQFHLGQFQDECYKELTPAEKKTRGMRMNLQTVRAFTRAIRYGSKYIYQTLPRVITIWLDTAEDPERSVNDIFVKINSEIARAVRTAPVYKWYTAFPQIVSRIGIGNERAYEILSNLIQVVISEYPQQALWPFTAVAKSTSNARSKRSKAILRNLTASSGNRNVSRMIASMTKLTDEFLNFCSVFCETPGMLSMRTRWRELWKLYRPDSAVQNGVLIPLQESLTANLPPLSASESTHQPFPVDAPTFVSFFDEVEVMSSLAKPKKLSIRGSNGLIYTFLGKKDDLRKDGRLMDFDYILNKLLKSDSEARKRQLRIRTYSVVSINEECGLIQWVPNTIPMRAILTSLYERRGKQIYSSGVKQVFDRIKNVKNNREAADIFVKDVLTHYPPVMHEWFIEMFPEPTYWFASRIAYSRTTAVMSVVGYILGLGDRHSENMLLDMNCGDLLHVDFECLFEKGQTLEVPEIVPFRLTQNVVVGLGVTGVEGIFRMACEVTLRLLRENKDCLMNVLDAFVHDPLVEWEEKRRRLERANRVKADMRAVWEDALGPIEEKLTGVFRPLKSSPGKQLSVSNHVQSLIHQASDISYLAKMYLGWGPHL